MVYLQESNNQEILGLAGWQDRDGTKLRIGVNKKNRCLKNKWQDRDGTKPRIGVYKKKQFFRYEN